MTACQPRSGGYEGEGPHHVGRPDSRRLRRGRRRRQDSRLRRHEPGRSGRFRGQLPGVQVRELIITPPTTPEQHQRIPASPSKIFQSWTEAIESRRGRKTIARARSVRPDGDGAKPHTENKYDLIWADRCTVFPILVAVV